jgi:hypothetical protein
MAKLNETEIKALATPAKGVKLYYFPDAVLQGKRAPRGFAVRVTAKGVRSFVMRYRNRAHVERLYTIGQYPDWPVLRAVEEARIIRQRIDKGEDPLGDRRKAETAAKDTLEAITAEYFKREGNGLKTAVRREQALERLVLPQFGRRDIHTIKRRSDCLTKSATAAAGLWPTDARRICPGCSTGTPADPMSFAARLCGAWVFRQPMKHRGRERWMMTRFGLSGQLLRGRTAVCASSFC